jgi:thioredoxin 1
MADSIPTTSDTNFKQDVIDADKPVLVDFWATWCGPCKAMAPHIEKLSDELAGRLKVVKLDIQDNPATPVQYQVVSVPTLLLFKGGKIVGQHVGAMNPGKLRAFVEPHL